VSGSEAEERIRAKVEAALKAEFPDARIVHELKIDGGLVRLDLAAVRADGLTLVEIKSERDVLKRLASQLRAAHKITGDVRVYATEKHRAELLAAESASAGFEWDETRRIGRSIPNPGHIPQLSRSRVRIETDQGFANLREMHDSWWPRMVMGHIADPRALVELLWRDELAALLCNAQVSPGKRPTREPMKRLALEHMTGRQIRLGVCAALRGRPFARADQSEAA
jgi:hypothetical protein